jgi:hypothetical protein
MDTANEVSNLVLHMLAGPDFRPVGSQWASTYVCEEFCKAKIATEVTAVAALLKSCEGVPALGRLYGNFFEPYAHHVIMQGGRFEVCDTLAPGPRGRTPAGHKPPPPPPTVVIDLQPSDQASFRDFDNLKEMSQQWMEGDPVQYYMPTDSNCPVIDSAIFPNILFQVTKQKRREITDAELNDVCEAMPKSDSGKYVGYLKMGTCCYR